MTDDSGPKANAPPDPDPATDDPDEIRAALAEIRRECRKVAFVYASLDAACVLLAVGFVAGAVGLPVSDTEIAAASFDSLGLPAPDLGTLAAVVAGVGAFLAEFRLRTRRPAAEQFEAANPEVREALRTARDAARSDRGDRANPMTQALYADVLERLRETSSVGLLNATRLAATVALAFALSLATVQTAVVGVELGVGPSGTGPGSGGPADGPADRGALSNQTADLRDGDEVLGEPTDVTAGSENLSAAVSASPGGEGERDWNYDSDAGGAGDDSVEAQRAGFSSPDRVEDAELVQRYAHQLETNATDD